MFARVLVRTQSSLSNTSSDLTLTTDTKNLAFANFVDVANEEPEPEPPDIEAPVLFKRPPLEGGKQPRGGLEKGKPRMLAQIGKKRSVQHFTMLSHRQMENYFGDVARSRFFDKFRAISSRRQQYTKEETRHFAHLQQHLAAHQTALRKEAHRARGEERVEKVVKRRNQLKMARTRKMKNKARLTSAVIDCGDSDDEDGNEDDSLSSHSDDALMDEPLDVRIARLAGLQAGQEGGRPHVFRMFRMCVCICMDTGLSSV